jgi:hypothetical protein
MSDNVLSKLAARRMEYSIIGLGIVALIMIFQPFSISLFSAGAMLVVLAGLVNNLLPLAQPGVSKRAMVVAMVFCIVLLVSITAAYLYGAFFLKAPDPNTTAGKAMLNATPFYMHSFVWSVAGVAVVLAGLITLRNRKKT